MSMHRNGQSLAQAPQLLHVASSTTMTFVASSIEMHWSRAHARMHSSHPTQRS